MKKYTKEHIAQYLVRYQGLNARSDFRPFCESLDTTLRCMQFDPLNIVGRNVDLFLQARISGYRKEDVSDALYRDRTLVDGWDKMMSVYSMKDWKKLQRLRDYKKEEYRMLMARQGVLDSLEHLDAVRQELAQSNGLQGKDLKLGRRDTGSWGQKNIGSILLEYLYLIGEAGVKDKRAPLKTSVFRGLP